MKQRPLVLDQHAAQIEILMTLRGVTYVEARDRTARRRRSVCAAAELARHVSAFERSQIQPV
jgi:hypothetical protein